MEGFELPLQAPGWPEAKVGLLVQSSLSGRLLGAGEPWFEVRLLSDGRPYDGATATQPLSCLRAVEQGRRTALMCLGGVMALQLLGEQVVVDYHTAQGGHFHCACSASDYRDLMEYLSRSSLQS